MTHATTAPGGLLQRLTKVAFIASILLTVVSWYTTKDGMSLYLPPLFAIAASLGVQALLLVGAWMAGITKERRTWILALCAITATISVSFSYFSIYSFFVDKERPAQVQRRLYDRLMWMLDRAIQTTAAAITENEKHIVALTEMTQAEKLHGWISRSQADPDPYLAAVKNAVASEARSYSEAYREGRGDGLRYTAFERYRQIAQSEGQRLHEAQECINQARPTISPTDSTLAQLRKFRSVCDGMPWSLVERTLNQKVDRPEAPSYNDYLERAGSRQEELLTAFQELFTMPSSLDVFALLLAAFIDVIVLLVPAAVGRHLHHAANHITRGAAAIDNTTDAEFTKGFLQKLHGGTVREAHLSPGERALCRSLRYQGLAHPIDPDGTNHGAYYLNDEVYDGLLNVLERHPP